MRSSSEILKSASASATKTLQSIFGLESQIKGGGSDRKLPNE